MNGVTENAPKLRFPEFSGRWVEEQLGDYFTFKNGVNADKSAYGSGRKFINVLDIIADGPITYEKIIGSVELTDSEFEKNEVIYGDILFQRSSETREEVGQSNVYLDRERSATFGGFVIRGRAQKAIHPEFFDCLLRTSAVRSDMTARSGGSTRYNVGQESLSQVKIVVPSSATEQQKIAAFLGAVDAKIGQLTRKKALLEDYKKGCMQQLFTQKLRFKDDQGNDFPDWDTTKLEDIVTIKKGTQLNRDDMIQEGAFPVINGGVTASGYTNSFNAPGGSITISEGGNSCGHVAWQSRDFWLGGHCYVVSANDQKSVLTKFLFHSLRHNQAKIMRLRVGSGLPNIQKGDLLQLTLGIPHPDEQQKIADFLSAIDAKISLVADELSAAQTFKKGLLQQMFV